MFHPLKSFVRLVIARISVSFSWRCEASRGRRRHSKKQDPMSSILNKQKPFQTHTYLALRVSNFSPWVRFWWLRGSKFKPLEDACIHIQLKTNIHLAILCDFGMVKRSWVTLNHQAHCFCLNGTVSVGFYPLLWLTKKHKSLDAMSPIPNPFMAKSIGRTVYLRILSHKNQPFMYMYGTSTCGQTSPCSCCGHFWPAYNVGNWSSPIFGKGKFQVFWLGFYLKVRGQKPST